MHQYDYLIIGCGLFGATFARLATDAGKSCLIIDKRSHIAGNCYTEKLRELTSISMELIFFTQVTNLFGNL